MTHRALCLRLDAHALQSNWRWLQRQGGAPAGAAVKADGYGLGAVEVTRRLAQAGCRDFFVSTWAEAEALGPLGQGVSLIVLHGVGTNDCEAALSGTARPVLNTPRQVARWKEIAPGKPCDVMIDTGMNRLGIRTDELDVLDGVDVATLMSHLASADEESGLNQAQLERFRAVRAAVPAKRYSLANSAGICLGTDYGFDLTRPGLALYGGIPRTEAEGHIAQVAFPEAEVIQRRIVRAGESVGYGATWVANSDTEVGVANIGYADGYLRCFAGAGSVMAHGKVLPLVGRVSMDLIAFDCSNAPDLAEGDWVTVDYDLPAASQSSGLSQYELLTGLSQRFERRWISAAS
ncbi:alanine racemase [Sphingomonas sp. HDW15A]|uniref:alanine racemase n=1 Tax=Sphingomonas sp. HDW15A TaxID=2714942 RepID=UPI0014090DC9|nr:alanine racemase [Sphingomonas sp. HDW15A]QIK95616.1 alanine racemase [Sphingomonas sp. HDW15A]